MGAIINTGSPHPSENPRADHCQMAINDKAKQHTSSLHSGRPVHRHPDKRGLHKGIGTEPQGKGDRLLSSDKLPGQASFLKNGPGTSSACPVLKAEIAEKILSYQRIHSRILTTGQLKQRQAHFLMRLCHHWKGIRSTHTASPEGLKHIRQATRFALLYLKLSIKIQYQKISKNGSLITGGSTWKLM